MSGRFTQVCRLVENVTEMSRSKFPSFKKWCEASGLGRNFLASIGTVLFGAGNPQGRGHRLGGTP